VKDEVNDYLFTTLSIAGILKKLFSLLLFTAVFSSVKIALCALR